MNENKTTEMSNCEPIIIGDVSASPFLFFNADNMEKMKQFKDNEFDLACIDPEYGIGMDGGNVGYKGNNNFEKKEWDKQRPTAEFFKEIMRISKNQIIWGGNYFADLLPPTRCFIVWDKMISEDFSLAMAELAWTSFDKLAKIKKLFNERECRIHETQKPVELYKWILENYTKPTDTILDCFGGSMSNAIACHMKRRNLTIIELDVDYFKSALNRFEIYERQVEDIKEFGYAKTKINAQNPVLF